MNPLNALTLINEQSGNLAFKVYTFEDCSQFDHIQRLNYFSLVWIKKGSGWAKVDFNEYDVQPNQLFALSPYQPFMFKSKEKLEGVVINFHPDFFCIHKHHQQVACNGVLFNNIYTPPYIALDEASQNEFETIIAQIWVEMQKPELAQYELLVSYLKILLISASRLKANQQPVTNELTSDNSEPFVLQTLKDHIEAHYKTKHSAGEYADLLNMSPKALAKIAKAHFNKTLTDLISERIIIEAKRELYLTDKSIKEIAHELGYEDEFYFSRFFKNNVDISPKLYRDTVGFAQGSA